MSGFLVVCCCLLLSLLRLPSSSPGVLCPLHNKYPYHMLDWFMKKLGLSEAETLVPFDVCFPKVDGYTPTTRPPLPTDAPSMAHLRKLQMRVAGHVKRQHAVDHPKDRYTRALGDILLPFYRSTGVPPSGASIDRYVPSSVLAVSKRVLEMLPEHKDWKRHVGRVYRFLGTARAPSGSGPVDPRHDTLMAVLGGWKGHVLMAQVRPLPPSKSTLFAPYAPAGGVVLHGGTTLERMIVDVGVTEAIRERALDGSCCHVRVCAW